MTNKISYVYNIFNSYFGREFILAMTGKQRAYFRGLANSLDAKYQIGKDGLSNNFINQIRAALEANELIKVHVLENSGLDIRETCGELCEMLSAEPIQVIGSKFVIYKESQKKKKEEQKKKELAKKLEKQAKPRPNKKKK